jgi:hypothetical protein
MSTPFPGELPWPTAGYVLLYLATLLLHAVFMSYVLAGSLVVAVAKVAALLRGRATGTLVKILVDWLPFALSAAITAGIAPLLFVQILYQEEFYTANLLSFHRWMAILPVLIVAFYLLYVLKARGIAPRLSAAVAVVVAGLVLFVGWSWVENHMLALDRDAWVRQYATSALVYREPAIAARLAFWVAAAIPTAAHLLLRQVLARASETDGGDERTFGGLARASIAALVVAVLLAAPVLRGEWALHTPALGASSDPLRTSLGVAGVGAALQLLSWRRSLRGGRPAPFALHLGALGVALFWWGLLSAREVVRLASLDTAALFARHARVATSAGAVVFLVFAVLALACVFWIAREVRRAIHARGSDL